MTPTVAASDGPPPAVDVADEFRVGVFVGDNRGPEGLPRLAFADADATKMHDLFVSFGGMANEDAYLLVEQPRRNVQAALIVARQRIAEAKAQGRPTMLVFYYSGHGDEHGLDLADTTISNDELRAWLDDTGADVRVAFLDSCKSGAVLRDKGGTRGPSYAFAVDVEQAKGTAILTSSAASEFSQESDEIGGGFFTYYLHTALAGAADVDQDGEVTLSEAYSYVHTETAFRTRDTPGTQTPSFDYDLTGAGDVRLTRLESASAWIDFPGGLDGTYAVWDEDRKRYVAEVAGAEPTHVAVRPGTFYVHHRMPGWVDQAEYQVRKGTRVEVSPDDFERTDYEDTAARGDLERIERRATIPDVTVSLVGGQRSFSTTFSAYVPKHPVAGLQARWVYGPGWYGEATFLSGQYPATIAIPEIGAKDLVVSSTSLAGGFGWAKRGKLGQLGLGVKAEGVRFARSFPDGDVDRQASISVAPGIEVFGTFRYKSWDVLGLDWSLMDLPVSWDEHRFPLYGDFLLSTGWRF